MEKDLSYEKLSAKLELMGISIHKQSLYDVVIPPNAILNLHCSLDNPPFAKISFEKRMFLL